MKDEALDFNVKAFSKMLARLPEHLQFTDSFEASDPQTQRAWYSSQREHMTKWFEAQATKGKGQYTRKTPNLSARRTWQRLASPGGMIWIAEALGVDESLLKQCIADVRCETEPRRRTAIIRSHIPWQMIAAKAAPLMDETTKG